MRVAFRSATVAVAMTATAVAICLPAVDANAAGASGRYKNCTAYHRVYPHGVGKKHAHDHTSGTPVTDFKHSTKLYKRAMRHNKGLDRDGDHIACEKA